MLISDIISHFRVDFSISLHPNGFGCCVLSFPSRSIEIRKTNDLIIFGGSVDAYFGFYSNTHSVHNLDVINDREIHFINEDV